MAEGEKVVARLRDGGTVKGYIRDFRVDSDIVVLDDPNMRRQHSVPIDDLKAIFFVKTFDGFSEHVERKAFGIRKNLGRKAFIKFNDKETLVGFIDGDIPWDKGFSLAKLGEKARGFFITPVDDGSNNVKVFVVGSAIEDITIMVA